MTPKRRTRSAARETLPAANGLPLPRKGDEGPVGQFPPVPAVRAVRSPGPGRAREGQADFPPRGRAARLSGSLRGRAPVAQRIEHLTTDQKVWGSNPYGRAFA